MIAWLEQADEGKPTTVSSATHDHGVETVTGTVTSTITAGELFLHVKGDTSQRYRLRWSSDDEQRARPLPVGTYALSGYRHIRSAADGAQWIWSTASPRYGEIEVKAGEATHCEVKRSPDLRTRAIQKGGTYRVGLAFVAEKRLGSTLYRNGKRITITWQCLDAEGEVLAQGPMRYG